MSLFKFCSIFPFDFSLLVIDGVRYNAVSSAISVKVQAALNAPSKLNTDKSTLRKIPTTTGDLLSDIIIPIGWRPVGPWAGRGGVGTKKRKMNISVYTLSTRQSNSKANNEYNVRRQVRER